ncbi:MAG: DJ-1/PfpI family protein [Thermoleophilia bacterium]|nr:DJ-1/PfpI family protein [Thermoleophilia bacterium]
MNLRGRTIGILIATGFDDSQIVKVAEVLRSREAKVVIIGTGDTGAVAVAGRQGSLLRPDVVLAEVSASSLDAIIVTGGESVIRIRPDERAMTLLLEMASQGKPIGAICNATAVLAAAGLVSGRRVTGDMLVKRDLAQAGGCYLEQGVVVDHNLVTSRTTENITHFLDAISFLLEPAPSLR